VLAAVNDLERPIGTYLYGRRTIGTYLYGRRRYETMVYWETASTGAERSAGVRDFAELWRVAEKVDYSRTSSSSAPPGGERASRASPESPLGGRGFRRQRRGERVRMALGQRKVAERETELPAPLCLDLLDRAERVPRMRALVVAVLDDHMRTRWAADVVDRLIEWLDYERGGSHRREPVESLPAGARIGE
jgi:hypothetical protein